MDNWLKALIAGACIVVIAGGGYFAYGEYAASKTDPSSRAERERCDRYQYELDNFDPNFPSRWTVTPEATRILVRGCRERGLI